MSTAQGGNFSFLLYVIVYLASLRTIYRSLGGRPLQPRPRPAALIVWLVVAVPSVLQLAWPAIYDVLSRQPALIDQGELWRLLTSVVVQDGGVVGTVYNLVTLALTAPAAVVVWRPVQAVGVFVAGALVFNVSATYLWHEAGGGNSAATFFLVTSMLGALLVRERTPGSVVAALVVAACGGALLLLGDAHGEAVLAGAALGAAAAAISRSRTARRAQTPIS